MGSFARGVLFCFILSCNCLLGYAQFNCRYEKFNTENGLLHNRITHIIKDNEGYVWTGSWDGLNRYDGRTFKTYKKSPTDVPSMISSRIEHIIDDKAGNIWISTGNRQIYQFNKATERFIPLVNNFTGDNNFIARHQFFVSKGLMGFSTEKDGAYLATITRAGGVTLSKHSLKSKASALVDSTHFIFNDAGNRVWIGSSLGLEALTRAGTGFRTVYKYQDTILSGVTNHTEDAANLYFGTTNGTIVCVDKRTLKTTVKKVVSNRITAIKRAKLSPVLYAVTNKGQLLQINIDGWQIKTSNVGNGLQLHTIYEDRSGVLWLEPGKQGVIRFDPSTQISKWFTHRTDGNENGSRNYHVFEDQTGRVWVNLSGGGLGYYNPAKNVIECEFTDNQGLTGYFPNLVYTVCFDAAGIIWLGTDQGIIKLNIPNGEFKQQAIKPNELLTFRANEVRGLLADRANRLWVGTRDGTLKIFKDNREINIGFDDLPSRGFGPVYRVFEDSKNNIWIGTKTNGLFKAVPLNTLRNRYKLLHFLPDSVNSKTPSLSNNVISFLEDADGTIWAGTFGKGLHRVNEVDGKIKFTAIKSFPGEPQLEALKIRHMQFDNLNNIWLATTTGLYVVNVSKQSYTLAHVALYTKNGSDAKSLRENDVQYILQSRNKRMWLATSGGGLELAEYKNPLKGMSFAHHVKKDGLLNDYILSIQEDLAGELWLGTQRGPTRFNPANGSSRTYGSSEGVFGTAISEGSVTRLQNGEIAFGTLRGILRFNPSLLRDDRVVTRLAFTNLQVNNHDVVSGGRDSILHQNIDYTSLIKLKHNQNTISLDFTILDFEHATDQNIKYRLKGYDTNWQNSFKQRRVTYTSLPPGNYVFEVKCANEKFYVNAPFKSLQISIAPPFWKTWWAYLIYLVILSGVMVVVLRTVKTILALRQSVSVEKKVAELKEEFFTNISHELRTTLTLITNPLAEISQREKLSPRGKSYLQLIARNTERLTKFMNQWLDLRKIQNKKAELRYTETELISYLTQIGNSFAGYGNNIKLEITAGVPQLNVVIDAEKIDLVVYNVLSNAFKYSAYEGTVKMHITAPDAHGNVQIEVADEGTGVPEQKLEDIFKLYYVDSEKDASGKKGTGIGLAVVKEIVNLHQGRVWAQNNSRGGLSVFITLPIKPADGYEFTTIEESSNAQVNTDANTQADNLLTPVIDGNTNVNQPVVLLVEDNNDLRELLANQLSAYYSVLLANNGEAGLQMALGHNPDLIISDIMMPKMNGIELLDKLKNTPATSHIPVVLLTAKGSVESQVEALQYGADYYLTKPFNTTLLLAAIAGLLKQRRNMFNQLTEHKVIDLSPGQVVITSKDEAFLRNVIKTVEEGMHNPEFSIEHVADAMAMGRTSFYKKFKSLTDTTTVDFIRDMRLKRAVQLMDAGEERVSMVAFEVGFNNPKYFSTCFKEKYHVSPTDYLKSIQKPQNKPQSKDFINCEQK